MTADERIATLEEQLKQALEQVRLLEEQLVAAHKRIEELEKQKTPPPAFAKANVKKLEAGEKKPRKKRAAQHNHGRRREAPTRIVEHRIGSCPACASRLGGASVARRRQVIEIAPPPPIEVTEHVVYHGWCSACKKWREAPLDVSAEVLGQGRLGVKITSLMAYLRTVMRLPVRQIQAYLATLHGLKISVGEIAEVLHRLKAKMEPTLAALKATIRASPAVQADETGWREDGRNGYIWSASTPQVRYYEYHHSRGHEVVQALLGDDFQGVLGSDFYAAYNIHQGLHQRCWVHFLRDGHDLKEQYADDAAVQAWFTQVKALYERARAYVGPDPDLPAAKQATARTQHQHALEQELWQLCAPYAHTSSPLQTLCNRVERFLPELFVFVARPEVPSDNGKIERTIGFVKKNFWPGVAFTEIADLNRQAQAWCERINTRVHGTTHERPTERREQEPLAPLPQAFAWERFATEERKVGWDGYLSYDGVLYGLPSSPPLAGTVVQVRERHGKLSVWSAGHLIVELAKRQESHTHVEHPDQFRNVAPAASRRAQVIPLGHQRPAPEVQTRRLSEYESHDKPEYRFLMRDVVVSL